MTMQQGSVEWKKLRAGKVTGSRISDLTARSKDRKTWGVSRANYMAELIAERLTGVPFEGFSNAAMQWGTDTESQARETYAIETLLDIEEIAFIPHPTIEMAGCSPDGLVGTDGMAQFKCPQINTHIETLMDQSAPSKYIKQIQWEMACTGRSWSDFVSFNPLMPPTMQLFVKRVNRDPAMISELESAVRDFLSELDGKVAALTKIYQRDAA